MTFEDIYSSLRVSLEQLMISASIVKNTGIGLLYPPLTLAPSMTPRHTDDTQFLFVEC